MPVLTRSRKKALQTQKSCESHLVEQNKPKSKSKPKAKAKSKSRAQSKAKCRSKSKSKPISKCKSKSKCVDSKETTNSRKRKLSDNSQKIGTPPNKKKNICKRKLLLTPSKQLAKSINKLNLDKDDEDEDEDEEDDEYQKIINIQEKLLTQEIDFKLVCREEEYRAIFNFLDKCLSRNRGGDSFYICGSPGTGKSATMLNIVTYFSNKKNRIKYNIGNIIKINGMSLNSPSSIYTFLYEKIMSSTSKNAIDAKNKLEKYFLSTSNDKFVIIIIDEMDGLLHSTQQTVLYHLFGWCKKENCKLILFGIANSIDLTDRFLPRLKQRNIDPELLIFEPYTKKQLIRILKYRLYYAQYSDVKEIDDWKCDYFDDHALAACAQKVSMYGDIRKCLEICRKSLNILISDKKRTKKKINFIDMKNILNSSFSSPLVDVIRDLPHHQKIIIVVISILVKENKKKKLNNYVIYNKLEQFYQFISKKYMTPKTTSKEFRIIINTLISYNIIKKINLKQIISYDTKLQILIPIDDIKYALQNDTVLNKLFEINMIIPNKYLST